MYSIATFNNCLNNFVRKRWSLLIIRKRHVISCIYRWVRKWDQATSFLVVLKINTSSTGHYLNQLRGTTKTDVHGEFSWIWTDLVWGDKYRILFWFIWYHSPNLLSYKHNYYIHWVVARDYSLWERMGVYTRVTWVSIYGYLKPL